LPAAAAFYENALGCARGRSSERWIDYDFWGHQLVIHLVDELPPAATNPVDNELVPASHFGPILPWEDVEALIARLETASISFVIKPTRRFEGRRGEQVTMFIQDPSGNHLEFKSFRNIDMLFASDGLDYP
jgi:extradiol dioxygenase family protein